MSDLNLKAQPRVLTGRKVRQLREQGLVPVVVYGRDQAPVTLQVTSRNLERVFHAGGMSQLVTVEVDGSQQNVLVREVQRDPVTHYLVHADLYAVDMTEKQQLSVPVVGVGEPHALAAGLMYFQAVDHVAIEALPADIPGHVEVDITPLDLERPITIADLPVIAGVAYLGELDDVIYTMVATRASEDEEAGEGESAEPEVIGRARQDED